eukprot:440129_1
MIGKFGPLITTVHGTTYTIYVNDINIMINDNGYKSIIPRSGATLWNDNINDFFFGDGNKWFHRRKIFATSFLFQMTTKNLSKLIPYILNEKMFVKIDKYNNKIYKTLKLDMQYIIFALIFALVFGEKYFTIHLPKENDKIFMDYITQIRRETDSMMYAIMVTQIFGINIGNYLNHNIFKNMDSPYQLDIVGNKLIKDYENYKSSYSSNNDTQQPRHPTYIDMLLNDKTIKRIEVIRDVILLFRAGDTSSSTIEQALYYLIKYQTMQNNIFNQLNIIKQKHNNNDTFSPLNYMNELHLLKAFVYELLRKIIHAPHSYPRYITKNDNVRINGYNIPKGSCVLGNHYYINNSTKYWEKPDEFYLQHFLDNNNKFKKNKHMMTFGTGRRGCPGHTVTVKLLFELFAHMILRYKFITNQKNKHEFNAPNLPFEWMTVTEKRMPIFVKIRMQ